MNEMIRQVLKDIMSSGVDKKVKDKKGIKVVKIDVKKVSPKELPEELAEPIDNAREEMSENEDLIKKMRKKITSRGR